MLRKPIVILIALVIAGLGFWLFQAYRTPPGIEPKGDDSMTIAWIGLATGFFAFMTAVVGLIQKNIETRTNRENR